jgi:DNA invertase Pin-like site-specific DNA recombinase
MLRGYCRISTDTQTLEPQILKLKEYGIKQIYTDIISGTKKERIGLSQLLSDLKQDDILVVVKLDRLGRSLKDLLEIIEKVKGKKANFLSLTEGLDTNTSGGKLLFNIFGAIAEFERDLIKERTLLGLESAKQQGKKLGRKEKLSPEQKALILELKKQKKPVKEICKIFNISKSSYYRIN